MGAFADLHAGPEDHVRLDDDVICDFGIPREENRFRCAKGHPFAHEMRALLILPKRLRRSEVRAVVDTGDFGLVRFDHCRRAAVLLRDRHNIGQVIFTLRIVVGDFLQQFEQVLDPRHQGSCVAKVAEPLVLGRVFIFDHLADAAGVVGDDSPIGLGVVGSEAEHDAGRGVIGVESRLHVSHRRSL